MSVPLFWPSARACPCGSRLPYGRCCGPLHRGERSAVTAEALMRSRYTAYVLLNEPYLLATWHSSTRPGELGLSAEDDVSWLGLTVRRARGGAGDREGRVEFVARCRVAGVRRDLTESSTFVREDGSWRYVAAEQDAGPR